MEDEILNALCGNNDQPETNTFAPPATRAEQIDYIIKNVNFLTPDQRKCVCKIIVRNNEIDKIADCNDGLAITTDISDMSVDEMYKLIFFELNRMQS
jgi:hypothetical protein